MTQQELDNIFNLDEEDLILSDELNKVVTERMRIVTDNFNTQAIQIKFNRDRAVICATTQSKDQFAKFKDGVPMNMDFEGNFNSNLSTIPFGIEHDTDLDFKMYRDPQHDNVSLNKIQTELGSVSINIYSRSAIVEDDE